MKLGKAEGVQTVRRERLASEFGFFDQLSALSPPFPISSLGFFGSCGFCFVFPELES